MKKVINALGLLLVISSVTVAVYASSSAKFTVNGVSVNGKISYEDTNDYNPIAADSVTVKTTAKASMDNIRSTTKIYYAEGDQLCARENVEAGSNCKSVSSKVKESKLAVGYRGEGIHYAAHNGKASSRSTVVSW